MKNYYTLILLVISFLGFFFYDRLWNDRLSSLAVLASRIEENIELALPDKQESLGTLVERVLRRGHGRLGNMEMNYNSERVSLLYTPNELNNYPASLLTLKSGRYRKGVVTLAVGEEKIHIDVYEK